MWTVVYVAQSIEETKKIEKVLAADGVLVKVRQIGKGKNGQGIFEVLVPKTEVEDAYLILTSITY